MLDESFIQLQFLCVVVLIEFEYEIGIEVEKDIDSVDNFFHYFEGSLRFDYCRFAESLFQIIDNFYISLFRLLKGLTLHRLHSAKKVTE